MHILFEPNNRYPLLHDKQLSLVLHVLQFSTEW